MIRFPDNNKVSLLLTNKSALCQLTQSQMLIPSPNLLQSLTVTRRGTKKNFNIAHLPNEITLNFFEYLDVFDSATLALTCKHMASLAVTHSKLNMSLETITSDQSYKPHQVKHFLKKRLDESLFQRPSDIAISAGCMYPAAKAGGNASLERKAGAPLAASATLYHSRNGGICLGRGRCSRDGLRGM
jgi:hypothetical protein